MCLFDLDGTLIDFNRYWLQMVLRRAERLAEQTTRESDRDFLRVSLARAMGANQDLSAMTPMGPVGLKSRREVIETVQQAATSFGLVYSKEEVSRVFDEIDRRSDSWIQDSIEVLPGARTLLAQLRQAGYPVAIVTSDIRDRAILKLKIAGLDDMVTLVVGSDMVTAGKPAPDLVHYVSEKLAVPPQAGILFGDADVDIQMGKSAGMLVSVGLTTGITPEDRLKELTPWVIAALDSVKVS
jgi:phosphoglycolate phosphatase